MLTNEEFLNNLKSHGVKDKPLEDYKGKDKHILFECHNNSEHKFYAAPYVIYRSKSPCPYCARREVFVGETDMWTTNPELATMLLHPEDGYKYFSSGSQYVDWVCPNCGEIINAQINQVYHHGLSCKTCGDGMSFAEKFVYSMFSQLGCDFIHNKTIEWSDNKMYDFYVSSMSLIVETHGCQHYEDSFVFNCGARTLEEEQDNDRYKELLARNNGIEHYIQLDCRKSDSDFIRKSVLNSELNGLFDLSIVDWKRCSLATFKSTTMECCDLWNSGLKCTEDIAKHTGLNICSVISKLKQAASAGLCDYEPNYEKRRPVVCVETGKQYKYVRETVNDGFNPTNVSRCCQNKRHTTGGYHWKYI